jgi:SPP1 family phage portal protein
MDINEFLTTKQDQQAVITELMSGRTTAIPPIADYESELKPKLHSVNNTVLRPDKWVKIDPEDVSELEASQVKSVVTGGGDQQARRIEKVARISLALQKLIVRRAVAFTFGNPVLLNADTEQGGKEDEVLKAVRKVLADVKSNTLNRRVARSIFSSTEAAELWYAVEKPNGKYGFQSKYKLRCIPLSPLNGDALFPYFDETGDMLAFSRQYSRDDNKKQKHVYFETYTDKLHYIWENTTGGWQLVDGYPLENKIGKIPVVYGSQQQVEWADVQNLIDRLEKLLSNFADTNDYHASPKIVVKGDILRWSKKGDAGSIIEMDDNGSADYLTWSQAPESIKLEIETLLRMIYTITQTPDISFDSVKGLNVSGVALELMFMDAHLKVMDKCEIFDEYMQRRTSIIQAYLAQMNARDSQFAAACESLTIEPEITPYSLRDEQAETNRLMTATGNKAIMSRRTAVRKYNEVDDVDREIALIEEEDGAANSMEDIFKQEPTE